MRTSPCVHIDRSSAPAVPMAARTELSVNSCRASRQRVAPSARRVSTSRRRVTARDNSRLATLAAPISRMQPTAPRRLNRATR